MPPRQRRSTRRPQLARFLQRDAGVTNHGPVQAKTWIAPTPRVLQLATRFCVVTFVDRKIVFAVRDKKVTVFDASDADAYSTLVRDEGMGDWTAGLLPQARVQVLTDLAARLAAAQQGLDDLQAGRSNSVSIGPDQATATSVFVARTGAGEEVVLTAEVSVLADGSVASVEVR